jgi:DNA polymerase-3 subunit gamma/tau
MSDCYVVLSRKYRPKDLDDLIGQEILKRSLKSCFESQKIPHAFLLNGMQGVGKTTTARIMARCLSCTGINNEIEIISAHACGTCRSCTAMDNDNHMDIMEIDAASRTGVDDIREIVDASQYKPIWGRYKIFIIDEIHMLSKSAFNALLKTLEEPPSHVKFIFATTEIHKVPETILSRCMVFKLLPIPQDQLSNYLVKITSNEGFRLDEDAARILSEESSGSVRDALSILEQAMMLTDETKVVNSNIIVSLLGGCSPSDVDELMQLILMAKPKEAMKKTDNIIKNGGDPFALYNSLQNVLYKLITESVNGHTGICSLHNLLYLWQIFLKQTENMKNALHPEHILNATIIILAYTASFPNIDDLLIMDHDTESHKHIINNQQISSTQTSNEKLVSDILNKFSGVVAYKIG